MPLTRFVMSTEVRNAISDFPRVVFRPAIMKKLVDLPLLRTWDELGYEPKTYDVEKLLRSLPDRRRFHRGLGDYHELHVPIAFREHREFYPDLKGKPLLSQQEEVHLLSTALTEEHFIATPILRAACGCFFSESAFRRIERFLDKEFFAVTEFNVGGA